MTTPRHLRPVPSWPQPVAAAIENGPANEIRVSQAEWRYSLGDGDGWDRGVYKLDRSGRGDNAVADWRMVAELPCVHRRIRHRDGSGRTSATSALMSATADGPRLVVDAREIRDHSWAARLGMPLSHERKVADVVATAIDDMIWALPDDAEAVPVLSDDGRIALPAAECLPAGYLAQAPIDRAAALAIWTEIACIAATSPNLAAALAASAGAWTVRQRGIASQSSWCDLPGPAATGKTTTLRVAAGVWGDPAPAAGVVLSWNATGRGIGGHLGRLGLLPAFVDESGTADYSPAQWRRLIMETTQGDQRVTGERYGDGARRSPPWQGVLFCSGNASVLAGLTSDKHAGVHRRVVTIAPPFTESAAQAQQLGRLTSDCYGHLGAELLERFTAEQCDLLLARAELLLPPPPLEVPGEIARLLHTYLAGAMMIDVCLELGDLMTSATLGFAAQYLADHNHAPQLGADLVLATVAESIAREPGRWPTVTEYREMRRLQSELLGSRPDLPVHGIGGRDLAGVQADDGSWVGVFESTWQSEVIGRLGVDERAALAELHARGALKVPESRRSRGQWQAPVRLMPKPAAAVLMYRLELPDAADAPDDPPAAPPADPDPSRAPAHVNTSICDGNPGNPPCSGAELDGNPYGNPTAIPTAIPASEAAIPASEAAIPASAADPVTRCASCGLPLDAVLVALGESTHAGPICARADSEIPSASDGISDVAEVQAEGPGRPVDVVPLPAGPAPARARSREWPWLVLADDGRAYGQDGEIVPVPRPLAGVADVGDLAALALELRCRVLWVPRPAREALRLPATLPDDLSKKAGMPHRFTEAADPARWDVWPAEPVGLAGWMVVYRQPSTLHEGASLAFPEWLPPVGDGPQLGDLAPADLAEALTLLWQATTYDGNGGRYGGANFTRSPSATMRRLLDAANRRRRAGQLEAAPAPAPYQRKEGSALSRVPGVYMPPVAGLRPGLVLAELDVRQCYLSAVIGTDFGVGDPERRAGLPAAEARRLPGVHHVTADRAAVAIDPMLWPMLAAPRGRQAEAAGWVDTVQLGWLADNNVPVRLGESWVWPEKGGRRVYESIAQRLGAALDELRARDDLPATAAAPIVKAMYARTFGGVLGSDFGGDRDADDPWQRVDHWLTIRMQAEVRKQRNLLPAIRSGLVTVVGCARLDSVYLAAESLEAITSAPGAGRRPLVAEQRGKFKIEAAGVVTAELAELLAARKPTTRERLAALDAFFTEARS